MLEFFEDIATELQMVEKELSVVVKTPNPLLTETSTHLLNAGGKRLRPALCLFGAKFYNFNPQRILPLATALELIHMATLVHDDVVDASLTRRGKPTVKAMWGNSISTHIGSYLFAKSLILIARYEYAPLISIVLASTSVNMGEGEIQQIAASFDVKQSFRDYLYRINRKTAMLIAASAQLGAVACGAPKSVYYPLYRYGHGVGMAFQITDDILDMVADQQELGKPIGSDLRQGIITLPVIYALDSARQKDRLRELVAKPEKDEDEMQEAISIITNSGAIERSFELVGKYINRAKQALKELPDIPTRLTLSLAADFVGARKY
ncbi:Heptaprenyl diphosphate synthase component 2 [Pelotomaculum schinkii]|uniref:Heptaprenyl diphosphate synthase component 2 n=1 Tax=Pelotomaculum schinkii TaxID=78350 RepID=A0A4Y7RE21_9FIRM|nr:polyprenyl synthetase family protein [Pelotomaculum schinkii]TEB07029.1 Heptaprenyl diphosphate synthase component 2 [Pelotomaculum schinkii]